MIQVQRICRAVCNLAMQRSMSAMAERELETRLGVF